jgi:phage tail-like protein
MASGEGEPLLRVNSFEVLIGDRELGFAEVSRLSSEIAAEPDAGTPPRASGNRFAPVVLRRAITTSSELFDWRRAVAAGNDDRRDVTIRQLSAPGGKVVNAWRLAGARPIRWSGPGFDALRGDIAFEEIELVFDDLVWLPSRSRNRGG